MSTVSIVMTTFNGEAYVKEQVESILSSDYEMFDLHIYDDCSSDNTLSILREYEKKHKDKIYVHQNKKNLGVTRNFLNAICNTTADYIMLCDQDDVWMPEKISLTLEKIKSMEGAYSESKPIGVFTDAIVVDNKLNEINRSFFKSSRLNPHKTSINRLLMENKLIGCTVMINSSVRDVLKSSKLPEKARFHDGWIALILSSMGKVGYLEEPTLFYRQHSDNVVGNIGFLSYCKDRITSIKRQKDSLLKSQQQAAEFYILYKDLLDEEESKIIKTYAKLNKLDCISKRVEIFRYGFWKTGFIRNIGVLLLI